MEAVSLNCWWFAGRQPSPINLDQFDPAAHFVKIREALESVDSLTNIRVVDDNTSITDLWGYPDEEDNENEFFPIFLNFSIGFDLFLPKRVQAKYNLLDRRTDDVEVFHVEVVCKRAMPVAYVHYPIKGDKINLREFSPSTAAVIVRRYLEEKLKDNPNIKFITLGPSPFHADLFLDKVTTINEEPKDFYQPGDGYHTFYFPIYVPKSENIVQHFIEKYHGTVRSFYELVRARNYANRLTAAVAEGAMELLEHNSAGGVLANFRRWRSFGSRIDEVFQALLAEKMNRVSSKYLRTSILDDEEVVSENPIYQFLEEELNEGPGELPDEDIRELLIMLEERRRGYFQNFATLFSGLVGGVLGALLGATLTFGLANHSKTSLDRIEPPAKAQSTSVPQPMSPPK